MLQRIVLLCCAAALLLFALPAQAAGGRADSTEAFVSAFSNAVDAGRVPFTIQCTQSVYDRFFGKDDSMLAGLYSGCGVTSFQYTITTDKSGVNVTVTDLQKYAGREIADAVRSGNTGSLTARERDALSAAMQIAAGVTGSPLEVERQLHDWLCRHVTYTRNDGPYSENDNAIGALLNGRADCDGYADAFYLLCTLAGIECRHVHGVGTDSAGVSGNHMWNAVRVNGKWVMVDVTWDDQDKAISYLYFNVGTRRMAEDHVWSGAVLSFAAAEAEDISLKPGSVYCAEADSWSGIEQRLTEAIALSRTHCQLQIPAGLNVRHSLDRLSSLIFGVGVADYQWSFVNDTLEIVIIRQHAHFRYCASEADAIAFIDSFAGTAAPAEIKLGFTQALGTQLFANDRAGLEGLLARSRLANPNTYYYSDDSKTVTLRDLAYIGPLTEVGNLFDLQAYLRSALADRPQQITFLIGGTLGDLARNMDKVSEIVYRYGLRGTYSYLISGGTRLTLSELAYYDEFAFCETRQEVLAYLQACRRKGQENFRIYCSDSLFLSLSQNGSSVVFDMLWDAGYPAPSLAADDGTRCFIVSGGS